MSFLTPVAFLFAISLPIVVLFYLLKRRRVTKLTSSTLLWKKFLAETEANAPLQRLRHHWLLILQLILLAAAVLAIARPFFTGSSQPSRLRVLVLDGSASMQSRDETPSRFELAKLEAMKWIDGMRDNEQSMILLAGATTEVKQSPTRDKATLRRALAACTASDGSTRLNEALQTASAFTYEKRGEELTVSGEIHLFSDGAAPELAQLANKNLPLIYHRIGKGSNNLGIVTLDVRANPDNFRQRALFTSISNPTSEAKTAQLELRFEKQVLETKLIELPPTNTLPVVFTTQQEKDGVYTVRLVGEDDLAVDNEASIYSILPQPVRILLVTAGNRFLEKGLRGAPNALVTVSSQPTPEMDTYDLVILDGITPSVWPQANVLAIRVANTNWFEDLSSTKNPAIVDWHHNHPLLRYVNFDNVDVAESLLPKPPAWGVALVQSQERPLIVAGEKDRHRVVWVGFDPLQSNWPLRISYPIFLANAVEWLNPNLSKSADLMLHVGEPIRYLPKQAITHAEILRPDGKQVPLDISSTSRELFYGDTSKHGLYRLTAGTNETTFCVNLLDSAETSIQPKDELPLGKFAGAISKTNRTASQELWRWFAGIALFFLMFEWWYYHKRTA